MRSETNALFWSMKALSRVRRRGASYHSILHAIANHYNEKTHCAWPSVTTLAAEAGVSDNTARAALRFLQASHIIQMVPTKHIGTEYQGVYLFRLPDYCNDPIDMTAHPTLEKLEIVPTGYFNRRYAAARKTVESRRPKPQLRVLRAE